MFKQFLVSALSLSLATQIMAQKISVKKPVFRKDSVSILKYGAVADGVSLNTKAINTAISQLSAKGGGVLVVPAGMWLTGPITLKSNVNLHLKANSILQFTDDFAQYPLVATNWEGLPQMRNQSPISAENATNIGITGSGIIDGNGDAWRMVKKDKLTESQWKKLLAKGGVTSKDGKTWYPTEQSVKGSQMKNPGAISPEKDSAFYASIKDYLRPNLMVLTSCRQIILDGVTFQNSPAWCLHPLMCQDLTVNNITVKNPWYAQNGDGIDIESCRNMTLTNSSFDVGDDGICIKSGRDEAGRKRGMPTENLFIENCTVYHAHGGFVIGSEMSGGARNIVVRNCSFIGTDIGLRFKTTRGRGGIVENIDIRNVAMKDIIAEAILFDMYYAAQDPVVLSGEKREPPKVETLPVTEATPQFRNFYISDIVCNGAEKAIFFRGLPEMNVRNIVLERMTLQAKDGLDMTEASGVALNNITLITTNIEPLLKIHNSRNISLNKINYSKARLLLNVSGDKTTGVVVTNTNTKKADKALELEYGAQAGSVQMN